MSELPAVSVLTTPYLCSLCFGNVIAPLRRPAESEEEHPHPWLPADMEDSQQSKVMAISARAPVELKPKLLQEVEVYSQSVLLPWKEELADECARI